MPLLGTRGAASARGFGMFGGKVVVGQQAYTTAGTYSWVAPAGVTSVSVVAVGGGGGGGSFAGGGGGGGELRYTNNITVTPGASYTVVVGAAGARGTTMNAPAKNGGAGGNSYFSSTAVVHAIGGSGGNGGLGNSGGAGGGAGGTGGVGTGGGAGGAGGSSGGASGGTGA